MTRPSFGGIKYAQLKYEAENSPDKEIDKRINNWIATLGISYKNVEIIKDRYGIPIDPIGKADLLQKRVQVVKNKANILLRLMLKYLHLSMQQIFYFVIVKKGLKILEI